jgi:hypothetical protein
MNALSCGVRLQRSRVLNALLKSSASQGERASALHLPQVPYASGEPVREDLYGFRRVNPHGRGPTVVAVTDPGHPRRSLTRMGVKVVLGNDRGRM